MLLAVDSLLKVSAMFFNKKSMYKIPMSDRKIKIYQLSLENGRRKDGETRNDVH